MPLRSILINYTTNMQLCQEEVQLLDIRCRKSLVAFAYEYDIVTIDRLMG